MEKKKKERETKFYQGAQATYDRLVSEILSSSVISLTLLQLSEKASSFSEAITDM